MKDKSLKLQLFRFVDVLPVLKTGDQIVAHIKEYFGDFQGEYKELLKFITIQKFHLRIIKPTTKKIIKIRIKFLNKKI